MKDLDEMRVYTLSEIMPVLGCTRPTLMNYISSGRLKAVKIGGKWKVSHDNLKKFVNGE